MIQFICFSIAAILMYEMAILPVLSDRAERKRHALENAEYRAECARREAQEDLEYWQERQRRQVPFDQAWTLAHDEQARRLLETVRRLS